MEGLQEFWEMVDYVNWKEMINEKNFIDLCRDKLRNKYSLKKILEFGKMARKLREYLKSSIENYSLEKFGDKYAFPNNSNVLSVSDDGFWDLTAHIVGLGRADYYECLRNTENILNYPKYRENFEYIFNQMDYINETNKKIWDDRMKEVEVTETVAVMDSNGNWIQAVPLNNDPEYQEYGAICNVINNSIENFRFKRFNPDKGMCDKYTNIPLKLYDAVLLYGDWDEIFTFAVVTDIFNKEVTVEYIDIYNDEEVVSRKYLCKS